MATKLYVGNLSYTTTNDSLRDAFAQSGTVVSATVLTDRMSGRSRGFGFVEMEEADAQKAIETWNGKDLDGRKLRVNEARPMAERPLADLTAETNAKAKIAEAFSVASLWFGNQRGLRQPQMPLTRIEKTPREGCFSFEWLARFF